jgi:hypothetical protein
VVLGTCRTSARKSAITTSVSGSLAAATKVDKREGVTLTVTQLEHTPNLHDLAVLGHACSCRHSRYDACHWAGTAPDGEAEVVQIAPVGDKHLGLKDGVDRPGGASCRSLGC